MENKVEFKVGDEILRGSLFIPKGKGPFPAVIFFHGSGSNGETYYETSRLLAENGIIAFMFNFRGCGQSDGDFNKQTLQMGLDDAKAGLNYFLSLEQIDKNRIGITGSSFGGFLAAMLCLDFDFKSIALVVPASYSPDQLNTLHTDDKRELRKDYQKSLSYEKIHEFTNNIIIFQSELEDILPEGMVEKYVEVASNAKRKSHIVLKGAGHRIKLNPEAKQRLLEELTKWFMETL